MAGSRISTKAKAKKTNCKMIKSRIKMKQNQMIRSNLRKILSRPKTKLTPAKKKRRRPPKIVIKVAWK